MSIEVKNSDNGRIIGGIILVGVGTVLLLKKTGMFFPEWLFSWPVILILVGIYSAFKHNFKNSFWIIAIATGSFFLISSLQPSLNMEPYFWPAIIILCGITVIYRPKSCSKKSMFNKTADWQNGTDGINLTKDSDAAAESNDYIKINSVFSGVNKTVLSKNFQGGNITCVFGGTEIDFTQADITGPVIVKSEVTFGGVKLLVPSNWAVQNDIEGIFHAVDDKRRFKSMPDASSNKVLILKGFVMFGGIEIRSA